MLELDVNDPGAARGRRRRRSTSAGARLDGVLHAIAFVPADALGGRFLSTPSASADRRLRDERVLAEGAGGGAAAAARARRGGGRRRPGLRRHRRVAGLRLGRRLQGRAGVDQPLPRARPRPARRALQPRRRRPAADRGGLEHRGLRRPRRDLGAPGAAGLGPRATRRRSPTRACSCSRRWRGRSPARSCTSTAACTRWGRRRCRLRTLAADSSADAD